MVSRDPRGSSTAQFAKCANCFAQNDDGLAVFGLFAGVVNLGGMASVSICKIEGKD